MKKIIECHDFPVKIEEIHVNDFANLWLVYQVWSNIHQSHPYYYLSLHILHESSVKRIKSQITKYTWIK